MAILGFQIVFSMVVLTIMNKFSRTISFARWLLTKGNLVRYLYPTNERLKEAIRQQNGSIDVDKYNKKSSQQAQQHKGGRHRRGKEENRNGPEIFKIPRNLPVALDCEPLKLINIMHLDYYLDLQWMIDFSFWTLIVYFTTEAFYWLFPSRLGAEYNLSIVWCILALSFIYLVLVKITWIYFRGGDDAIEERSMCIVFGCFFFLLSMVILIVDEDKLEFGLLPAYQSFSESSKRLIETQGLEGETSGPTSFLMLKFCLAVWSAFIGMFFTFPGMRVGRMHKDALIYAQGSRILPIVYHTTYILPIFVILSWFKPVARHYLTVRDWPNRGVLMLPETFESLRLLLIVILLLLRLCLFRPYLQAYLNIAPQKLNFINRQSGKISNVELQKTIARVHCFLPMAALQYLAPILMCLFMAMLTKSTGDYHWLPLPSNGTSPLSPTNSLSNDSSPDSEAREILDKFYAIFNATVLRGLMGFTLWWCCTVWFATSSLGYIYHNYFDST